jgi:hypothetical protein
MAVVGDELFYLNGNDEAELELSSVPLAGGSTQKYGTVLGMPVDIVGAGEGVVVAADPGFLRYWSAPGGGNSLGSAQGATAVASDGSSVFVSMEYPAQPGIYSMPLGGGGMAALSDVPACGDMVAVDGYVYFGIFEYQPTIKQELRRMTPDGAVESLIEGYGCAGLAAAGSRVFFFDGEAIVAYETVSSSRISLATASYVPSLVADAENVYWGYDGPLWRVATSGGPQVKLVDGSIRAIAQDERAVYFLETYNELWKIAK